MNNSFRFGLIMAVFGGPGVSLFGSALVGVTILVCVVGILGYGAYSLVRITAQALGPTGGRTAAAPRPCDWAKAGYRDTGYRW